MQSACARMPSLLLGIKGGIGQIGDSRGWTAARRRLVIFGVMQGYLRRERRRVIARSHCELATELSDALFPSGGHFRRYVFHN